MSKRVISKKWEQGSEYNLLFSKETKKNLVYPWGNEYRKYSIGRDAIRDLLKRGIQWYGWERILIPEYLCQEVVDSIVMTGIKISSYPIEFLYGNGKRCPHKIVAGDILLRVNIFGLGLTGGPEINRYPEVLCIEDHTHDPFSTMAYLSTADWCFCSLRKTLPIPDGAILWSPTNNILPTQKKITTIRERASLKKLSGMILKTLYLYGTFKNKDIFRHLATKGEEEIWEGKISGMSEWSFEMLRLFPIERWRVSRCSNYSHVTKALSNVRGFKVIHQFNAEETIPFSVILLFDSSSRRDYVRRYLLNVGIYPAILWSLKKKKPSYSISQPARSFSNRMLSIHCDMRYSKQDMDIVIVNIRRFNAEYRP